MIAIRVSPLPRTIPQIDIRHPILRGMLRTERLKYPERACDGNDLCPSREGDVDFYERIPVAFGLFARVDIPANTTLLEYTGEVFDYQDWYVFARLCFSAL
jgi:hypothetical protein